MAWLDAFLDAYMADYRAASHNETYQSQSNGTIIFGSQIGDVDVTNLQSAETHQEADLGSGGPAAARTPT